MGEAVSTASLTVEDIGEKFPESKSELRQPQQSTSYLNYTDKKEKKIFLIK